METAKAKEGIYAYVEKNLEQVFILFVLLVTVLVHYSIADKLSFLDFYFLPIIVGGYYLGRRKAVLGALLSFLYVAVYAVYSPEEFLAQNTTLAIYLHIASWGGFLMLAGAVVGRLQEKLAKEIEMSRQLNEGLQVQREELNRANAALKLRELDAVAEGQRTREHLAATLNIATELSSELMLGPLLRKIMATVTKMLNAERSTLFLNDEKTKELYTEVGEGLGRTQIRMPNSLGIAGASFTSSRAIMLSGPRPDSRFNAEVDRTTGFQTRSLLCIPVVNRQGKTIGVTDCRQPGKVCRLHHHD